MNEHEKQPQQPPESTHNATPASSKAPVSLSAQEMADLQAKAGQAQEYLELLQLKQADFENFRKRVRKEQGEWSANAEQSVLAELLPILDNFERALKAAQEDRSFENLCSGITMILDQMEQFFSKRGVEAIDSTQGRPFDPRIHEAVMSLPNDSLPANHVVETLVKGYKRGERILRPAQVAVSTPSNKSGDMNSSEDTNHADV